MTETMYHPQVVRLPAVAHTGAATALVGIRAEPDPDRPTTTITGLPADEARTTCDRIRSAIVNVGLAWPRQPITLSVVPNPLPAADPGMDVTFAVAVLAASGQIPHNRLTTTLYLGELGLDGSLRALPDLSARLAGVAQAGLPETVVPTANLAEASLSTHSRVRGARTLADLAAALRGQGPLRSLAAWPTTHEQPDADLADLPTEWHQARRVLEVAAVGGHHLLMIGPAAIAELLAHRLPGLLPNLDAATAGQVAAVHRQAGTLPADAPIRRRPPWQAVHHTISVPDLAGTHRRPGAAALAHGGVLWCPDVDRMNGRARDILRLVHDQREITNAGASHQATYPARTQLLLSATGCPEPAMGADCGCPQHVHNRILARTAVLLDRADIRYVLPPVPPPHRPEQSGADTASAAGRVAAARALARTARRWPANAEANGSQLKAALARVPARWFNPLRHRIDVGSLSARGATKVLRVAFTIADLAGHGLPTADDLDEAICLHTGRQATAGAPPRR